MRSELAGPSTLLAGTAALLAGAFAFEHVGGLVPCEMCWWQRWALMGVVLFAGDAVLLGAMAGRRPALWPVVRLLGWAGLLALLANAGIALFHAGVEQKWWQGLTRCTAPPTAGSADAMLADILAQPLVRCDAIPWQMFGVSMAGWNFLLSLSLAGAALWLMLRR
jgi:disulfide bond formation protein DsbB